MQKTVVTAGYIFPIILMYAAHPGEIPCSKSDNVGKFAVISERNEYAIVIIVIQTRR